MTPKDRVALAAYAEMLDDTVDLRNDSVGMDGGDPVRLLLAEHDRLAAELRRLRISQLRRMSQLCGDLEARSLLYAANCQGMNWRRYHDRKRPIIDRADRFRAACLAEIERLRGEG